RPLRPRRSFGRPEGSPGSTTAPFRPPRHGAATCSRMTRSGGTEPEHLLLPAAPFQSLDDYAAAGGGRALPAARARGAEWVLAELDRSGLRGRGGAGFPAGAKWRSVRAGGTAL